VIDMAETEMAETGMAETSVKRHPIAAVLWGIVGGVGVSLFLMGRAQIAIGKWIGPIVIVLVVVALNLLWAYFGPAKKPKGPPPVDIEPLTTDAGPASSPPEMGDAGSVDPPPDAPPLAPPPGGADEGGSEDPTSI
jgi:hypothetical protein